MNVQPISKSKPVLNWKNPKGNVQNRTDTAIKEEEKKLALISDYLSPSDIRFNSSKPISDRSEKKSKPLSYTSENWIG